jgi:hypothetical protein
MLCYRVPREPSAPRIAIWRKLKRLGVAQLSDGLVALPADARTREQLEWAAQDVTEAGGEAQERELAAARAAARAAEYTAVAAAALLAREEGDAARAAALRRLRAELRRITRRDYFPPAAREQARTAVEALAAAREPDRIPGSAAAAGGAGERS